MIHFDLPKEKSSIIKVIGVGGGGSNAVNYMYDQQIEGVDFIICNTDAKALEQSKVPNKIQLGPDLTQGLGAGANPQVGKQAAEESIEEIRRILEINTKMAFITAGMGGGTGTGGAPIVAKICKELGILTVGIVTTPFPFEGPRRLAQAEAGIRELTPFVDTLLVISNDKLRMQYGNLKWSEAFGRADDVLATAAKCITDIINSRGHIIVDFADVCTVMKNGGVAILGSATAEGEDRAQRAIEEAITSPLLNDSDIRGARWILININSAEGEYECTMDEMETITAYLRQQAGDDTDVIAGLGYDTTLERKLGITLIATGFDHKDPFTVKPATTAAPKVAPVEEKVVLTLDLNNSETTTPVAAPKVAVIAPAAIPENLAPTVAEYTAPPVIVETPAPVVNETPEVLTLVMPEAATPTATVEEQPAPFEMKLVEKPMAAEPMQQHGFLNKPQQIYNQQVAQPQAMNNLAVNEPFTPAPQPKPIPTDDTMHLELVVKEAAPEMNEAPVAMHGMIANEEEELQRRRAQERVNRLRNLSFNVNSDLNNEYDNVPAYVRKNLELYGQNQLTSAENYYSRYAVKKEDGNNEPLSTLNSFLEGKKPD